MRRAIVCVVAVAALVAHASADATATLLWPVPQSVNCVDGTTAVSPTFTVTTGASNTILAAAMDRYQSLYRSLAGASHGSLRSGDAELTELSITVNDASGDLTPTTSLKCVAVGCGFGGEGGVLVMSRVRLHCTRRVGVCRGWVRAPPGAVSEDDRGGVQ